MVSVPEALKLPRLARQIDGIFGRFVRMLDDEFLFAAGMQVPQAATIFDLIADKAVPFDDEAIHAGYLLALIAMRYGFERVELVGHGGYAVVLGHASDETSHGPTVPADSHERRRVLRLVPEHHVPDITGGPGPRRAFDVRLDANDEPIRDPDYPLLLSDLLLLPRHSTRLIFLTAEGQIARAGGKEAILHCQLLPQVIPFNAASSQLDQRMTIAAGQMLEAALATLGVTVVDAHGGNGGVLVGLDGRPLVDERRLPDGSSVRRYVPIVLDYGYYAEIGPNKMGSILAFHGVTPAMVRDLLQEAGVHNDDLEAILRDESATHENRYVRVIDRTQLPRTAFGHLLYRTDPPVIYPDMWITDAEERWQTANEKSYPPLRDQARLNTLYPAYDEIVFPQRIEQYRFPLMGL